MKKIILLTVLFAVMCVTTSQAMTILIDGSYLYADAGGTPIVTWYQQAFPGATVTTFNGDDTANATVQATIAAADLLVLNRRTSSGGYTASDGVYYSSLTIPIIFHTSYVTRSTKIAYEGGLANGAAVDGSETTVTAAGAAAFGVAAGTYDFYASTDSTGFDSVGCVGLVGTGKILATIGGYNLAVLWDVGDTDGSGRVQAGKRLLYNVDTLAGGITAVLPETTAGLAAFSHVIKSLIQRPEAPYDPVVTPVDAGVVGNLVKTSVDPAPATYEIHDVVLGFKAGHDPNGVDPFNLKIVKHNIYLQTGAPTDPNLYLYDSVDQVSLTDPSISYGPLPNNLLEQGTVYNWKVEEVIKDPNGNEYPAGNSNNIMGDVWNFTTASAMPVITTSPVHTLTDLSGSATLSIETGAVANYWRWYKEAGDTDTKLTDSTIAGVTYSGTQTKTLTITGMADNGSEDAQYYAIAYNGYPESGTAVASSPSATVWVWYPRLVNHYAMETMTYDVDPNGITPDAVNAAFSLHMASNDTGVDFPVLDPNVAAGITGTKSLKFNNPRGTDPNSADAQYAKIAGNWVGGYKDITISMWVYSHGGSAWNRLIDLGTGTTNNIFVCVNTGSVNRQLRLEVNVNGTIQNVTTADGALPDHEWTFVSCTLTGSTARIYVNGELAATSTTLTNDPVSFGPTTNNWLGRSQYGAGDGYFNGMLDELKIYNYARTTVQVGQDYLADTQGAYVCNLEIYDLASYDTNENCLLDLADFASLAARWLEDDRIYPAL